MNGVGCVRQGELCASALHLTRATRQFSSATPLCAGTMGLKGDLTAGEIVEQLVHAQRVTTIKNVVFMVSNRVFPSSAFTIQPVSSLFPKLCIHICCAAKVKKVGLGSGALCSTKLPLACVA